MAGRHVFSRKAFRGGEGGWFFSSRLSGAFRVCGVSRGCSLALRRFRARGCGCAAFGPLSGGPVGRFCPGVVVPPFPAVAVGVCRGCPVPFVCGGGPLRWVVGSPLAAPPRLLRGAPGPRWFRGVGSGLPLRSALPLWLARPGGGSRRRRRAARPGGVVSPLLVFVAGLAPGCAPWSPWPPRPGMLLVACPSRLAAEHCRRRAAAFGLAAAGPLAVSRRWLVAVRWVVRPPSALAIRLGAGPVARSLPLCGVPLPVPRRGGASRPAPRPRAPRPVSLPLF